MVACSISFQGKIMVILNVYFKYNWLAFSLALEVQSVYHTSKKSRKYWLFCYLQCYWLFITPQCCSSTGSLFKPQCFTLSIVNCSSSVYKLPSGHLYYFPASAPGAQKLFWELVPSLGSTFVTSSIFFLKIFLFQKSYCPFLRLSFLGAGPHSSIPSESRY